MNKKELERFQKAYHSYFSSYMDILHEQAWKKESLVSYECAWFPDEQPRKPPVFVPLSQQLRETEMKWARLELYSKAAEIFEKAVVSEAAASECADGLASQAAARCEHYELEFDNFADSQLVYEPRFWESRGFEGFFIGLSIALIFGFLCHIFGTGPLW